MALTGTVKKFLVDKGFGFITPNDGGEDVFIHLKQCNGAEILNEGDAVSYDNEYNDRKGKMQGTNLTVIGGGGGGGGGGGLAGAPMELGGLAATGLVEEFIEGYALDERAATALRDADPMVQYSVLEGGSVSDCQNPSSAVLGRIRAAMSGKGQSMQMMPDNWGKGGGCVGGGGRAGKGGGQANTGLMDLLGGGQANSGLMDLLAGMMGGSGGGYGGAPSIQPARKRPANSEPVDIEAFIARNDLDERAADAVRGCTPEVQQMVVAKGDMKECHNPGSVVMTRIKVARAECFQNGTASATEDEVELFILECGLDERAADAMRSCAPRDQRFVIDRGSTQTTRNPSSAILGRIRDAKKASAGLGGPAMSNSSGAGGMSDYQQMLVALLGIVQDASSSSGSAWSGGSPGPGMMGGGGCGGGLRDGMGMSGGGGGGWKATRVAAQSGAGAEVSQEVADFVTQNNLDSRAANDFLTESPEVQAAVMARGDLAGTRNPSSAMLGRIRDAKKGDSGGGKGGRSSPY